MANDKKLYRTEQLQQVVVQLNSQLSRLGLGWSDFNILLKLREGTQRSSRSSTHWDKRIRDVAHVVVKEQRVPKDITAFRKLLEELSELLNIPLSFQVLESRLVKIGSLLGNLFALLLFCFITYIVVGGIAIGQSRLMGESGPIPSLGVLLLLIIALALLEGLQISVTTLRLRDFQIFRRKYPRAVALHRKFRDAADTNRFLEGRQLLVIMVVFFAARLTSFPELMAWPFTSVPFPKWMAPWFEVLLDLGIPGALFVLWSGQLAPQLIANRNPLAFLNLIGMRLVLNLSFLIETIRLTRPGNWFSRLTKEGPDIPISDHEKYRQETEIVHGYGIIGQKKIWEIGRAEATLYYQNLIRFAKSGFHGIFDRSLVIRGTSVCPSFTYELLSGDESLTNREIYAERTDEERLPNELRRLNQTLKPKFGSFEIGDIICTRSEIKCPYVEADQIIVNRPTQYILFHVRFYDEPNYVGKIEVKGYKMDEYLDNPAPFFQEELVLSIDQEGVPFAEFMKMYPEVGTTYILEWDTKHE